MKMYELIHNGKNVIGIKLKCKSYQCKIENMSNNYWAIFMAINPEIQNKKLSKISPDR